MDWKHESVTYVRFTPAAPLRDLKFYLAGSGRNVRAHDPNAPANAGNATRAPIDGQVIEGGGTDVRIA